MRSFLLVAVATALIGCGGSSVKPEKVPDELESWVSMEVTAPATSEIFMPPQGTFARVAEKAYGHRNFAGFLAVANGVEDPDHVKIGVIYQTPCLTDPFAGSRLNERSLAAVHVLAVAATQFNDKVLPDYLVVRRATAGRPGDESTIQLEPPIRDGLLGVAQKIEAAALVLSEPGGELDVPRATIGQFRGAAEHLRALATGAIDGYGYDYDMVGQRMGLGFTYLLIWAGEG